MSRHRNPRRRTARRYLAPQTQHVAVFPGDDVDANGEPVATVIDLAVNANDGKRHASGLAFMDGFVAELAAAERDCYRPLTVSTPIKRARVEPRFTSYTI